MGIISLVNEISLSLICGNKWIWSLRWCFKIYIQK